MDVLWQQGVPDIALDPAENSADGRVSISVLILTSSILS